MPLYEIIVCCFCKVLKYVVLEGKLCPPRCDRYLLSIHYCCSLTEVKSVTKDCASRQNCLQSGQASLRKYVLIQQHILPLPDMVCKWFLRIFKCVFDKHILIEVVIFFLFLLVFNNIYIFSWYKSNVHIFRNVFCTVLKYILFEGIFFPPKMW